MTTTWQTLIQKQKHAPQKLPETTSFIPLPELGILSVSGDDATDFLQNLLTNDVKALAINQSQLSSFCNAKGRLYALFLLIRRRDHYQLILPKNVASLLQQRLNMYVLRSKVTINNDSENLICLGLGNCEQNTAKQLDLSEHNYQIIDKQRSLCIVPVEESDSLLQRIEQQDWQLAADTVWNLMDIDAGIAHITPETLEKFTPQQLNLDLVDGVSFQKGCYPGQEVVARLHYLGSPSRRMFKAYALAKSNDYKAGDEVKNQSGETVGNIVNIAPDGADNIALSVSIKLSQRNSELVIGDATTLTLMDKTIPESD